MRTPEEFLEDHKFITADKIDRQALILSFVSEMEKGLKGEPSSLMMIPTYVGVNGHIPEGSKAIVLDAGGTNFRGAVVSIPPGITQRANQPMPGAQEEVSEEVFYAAFVDEVKRLQPRAGTQKIGWCFSYPAEATPKLDAKLDHWTKNIKAPSIEGQYVGQELLKRLPAGYSIAVVNDTVATLLAAKATEGNQMYSSYIGFILGTGTNSAYVEKNIHITKLSGLDPEGSMIINAESGGFNKIEQSVFDEDIDRKTTNPGAHIFEKMISGAYLGPIGLEIYKAAAKEGLFSRKAAEALVGLSDLETRDFGNFCACYHEEERENPLAAIFETAEDRKMARRLGLPVFERAAVLTAIHLAAFVIQSGEGFDPSAPVAINIDGSTFYKTKAVPFAELVTKELDDLLVRRRNIHYTITPQVADAPLVGAGIAALLEGVS